MKAQVSKGILMVALTAAIGLISTNAMAVALNPFQVTESSIQDGNTPANPALLGSNYAGKITGGYQERADFTPKTATTGDVNFSLLWNAGQFCTTAGACPMASYLGNIGSTGYEMYALVTGTANYSTNLGTGKTTFNIHSGGSLQLFIDAASDTTFTDPGIGGAASAWGTANTADDYLIAQGANVGGLGVLDPSLATCLSGGLNCGSFGENTTFALTAAGKQYFTFPVPFYNLAFTSGQFNSFDPYAASGSQAINGSLDATFGVPEPENVALMGIGLLAMAGMLRKNRKQGRKQA